jgi:elongation factor G
MAKAIEVIGRAKYAKQTGGRGQYGHVVLRLTVGCAAQGVTIANEQPQSIPAVFIPAVEAGIRSFVDDGKLRERGYSDARIELVDGSYHDRDSSDAAFFTAAVMAMEDALRQIPQPPGASGDVGHPGVREPRSPRPVHPASSIALPEPLDND